MIETWPYLSIGNQDAYGRRITLTAHNMAALLARRRGATSGR